MAGGAVAFGREYLKAELDTALAAPDPFALVPHRDTDGHGTVTASIAAGNGRAGHDQFIGIAPLADLIIVAFQLEEKFTLGKSTRALAAYDYIARKAHELGRPVAINQSQGMNGGGHMGETLLETGLDNLLRQPGVVGVKAAGNERNQRTRAGGMVGQGQTMTREYFVLSNKQLDDVFEIGFAGTDKFSVAVLTRQGRRARMGW